MKWRDVTGQTIAAGDIIEDTARRVIGKVVIWHGLPAVQMFKRFSVRTIDYEPIDYKGPDEAYIRGLVDRHTKVWWWLHGYRLDNVEIIKQAERRPRSNRRTVVAKYDAATPWQ